MLAQYFDCLKESSLAKQSTLLSHFDVSAGTGTYAPRKKQAYASRRLQKLVVDFRKSRQEASATPGPGRASRERSEPPAARRRRKASAAEGPEAAVNTTLSADEGEQLQADAPAPKRKRRKVSKAAARTKAKKQNADGDHSDDEVVMHIHEDIPTNRQLRPR